MYHFTDYHINRFLRVIIAVHLLGVCLFVVPDFRIYGLVLILGSQIVLVAQGLWPRSQWLGTNIIKIHAAKADNAVYITIDDGPDSEVTPQVLQILDQYQAKATFFCIGEKVNRHPELANLIVACGHRLENHSMAHSYRFSLWGTRKISRDIASAQISIQKTTGVPSRYFRAPAGLRNVFLDFVLQKMGLRLVSWTRRGFDTQQRDPEKVLDRLCRNLQAGDILLLHDGNPALTRQGKAVIVEVLPVLLQKLQDNHFSARELPDDL